MCWWARITILLLCVLLVAAVCSPQQMQDYLSQGTDYVFEEREAIDYALVIDRSGSMRVGNRFSEAQAAASGFSEQLVSDDRAAVISFDSSGQLVAPFSSDEDALKQAINSMRIGDWTQYQAGLYRALEAYATRTQQNRGVVVFMSDGRPDDNPSELDSAVNDVLAAGLCLYTIAYADEADDEAQRVLESMALRSVEATGCGGYFRAEEDTYDLRRIYSQIYDETSSQELFDVAVDVDVASEVSLSVSARSSLNSASFEGLACFEPVVDIVVLRDDRPVFEQRSSRMDAQVLLERGEYEYFVSVRETCGGACSFTGSAQGSFVVDQGAAVCSSSFSQIRSVVRSTQSARVFMDSEGFVPVEAVTDGVVSWENRRSAPVSVVGTGASGFESPPIPVGGDWSFAFPAGRFLYEDDAGEQGVVVSQPRDFTAPGVDVVVVVDRSGSMAGEQMRLARDSVQSLLGLLGPRDRASVVTFSSRAQVLLPLTSDFARLQRRVGSISADGSTSYVRALEKLPEVLRGGRNQRQVVIFVSDGLPTDQGGLDAVMSSLRENLGGACLYTVGYGDEGVLAAGALSSMASYSQRVNGCGLFYFAAARDQDLSEVLGEVFSLSKQPDLELYDVSVESSDGSFLVSTRVRSAHNGLGVPSRDSVCIPPADVSVVVDDRRFPLRYSNGVYSGMVPVVDGLLVARVVDQGDPSRVLVGSVALSRSSSLRWWVVGMSVMLVLLVFAKIFMVRTRPSN